VCEWIGYRFFKEGEVIYQFGQSKNSMYVILDGEVNFTLNVGSNIISEAQMNELEQDIQVKDLKKTL
jgi:hypothetical protein